MGGDNTNRRHWTTESIQKLVSDYKAQDYEYYNPITKKVLRTKQAWKSSIAVKMDVESLTKLLFELEEPHYSEFSGLPLTIEEYHHTRGFSKYTKEETENRVWLQRRDYTTISNETKKKISHALKMYNKTDKGISQRINKSLRMREFYSTDAGKLAKKSASKKSSKTMRVKIAMGEFSPPITNSWTHWEAYICIDNKKIQFRSSWEACVWFCNQHLVYETIRVKSGDKIFICDFVDEHNKIMYEIKPKNRYNVEARKMSALANWCIENGYRFKWINEHNIANYIDYNIIKTNQSAIKQYSKINKYINRAKTED